MIKIEYNGFEFSRLNGFAFNDVDGLTAVPRRQTKQVNTNSDGGVIFKTRKSFRVLTFSGFIRGLNKAEINGRIAQAGRALSTNQKEKLKITTSSGSVYTIPCSVSQGLTGSFTTESGFAYRFIFQLEAGEIGFLEPSDRLLELSLEQIQGFDIPFNIPFDIVGGTGMSDSGTVIVNGDYPVIPRVRFTGGVINPTLNYSGGKLQYADTLASGHWVEYYFEDNNLFGVNNFGASVLSKTIGKLPSFTQNSQVTFTASEFNAEAVCKLTYRNALEAITL